MWKSISTRLRDKQIKRRSNVKKKVTGKGQTAREGRKRRERLLTSLFGVPLRACSRVPLVHYLALTGADGGGAESGGCSRSTGLLLLPWLRFVQRTLDWRQDRSSRDTARGPMGGRVVLATRNPAPGVRLTFKTLRFINCRKHDRNVNRNNLVMVAYS